MLEPGQVIDGRFEVEELIGQGGLAEVYRVRHTALGGRYALKLLTWRKRELAERLITEGRIQAQLDHPNIVGVTDLVRHDGQFALLMEYVDSSSLDDLLYNRGGLGFEAALALFAPILSAVAAAHDAGVTHRDLKPANILLARGRGDQLIPKVTDFGIAKVVAQMAEGSTAVGATMGTPGYLAPEQISDSSNIDERADIFALAAIFFEMVTGRAAFEEPDGTLQVMSTSRVVPPPIGSLVEAVPAWLDEVLARGWATNRDERISDCRDLADELYRDHPELVRMFDGDSGTRTLSLSGANEAFRSMTASSSTLDQTPVAQNPTLAAPVPGGTVDTPTATSTVASSAVVGMGLGAVGVLVLVIAAGGFFAFGMKNRVEPPDADGSVRSVVVEPGEEPAPAAPVMPAGEPPVSAVPTPSAEDPTPKPPAVADDGPAATTADPVVDVPSPSPTPSVPAKDPAPPRDVVTPTPVDVEPEPEPVAADVEPVEAPVEPAPPEPVEPDPSVPVADPTDPSDAVADPTDPSDAVADAAVPEPLPAPPPPPPEVAGTWGGDVNRRPVRLVLNQSPTGALSGELVFIGPTPQRMAVSGSVRVGGRVDFTAADFVFSGTLVGNTLNGTYSKAGGKRLAWSVER